MGDTGARSTLAVALGVALTLTAWTPCLAVPTAGDGPTATSTDWRDLLSKAAEEGRHRAYQGWLLVVGLRDEMPLVREVWVAQGKDGELQTSPDPPWLLGRMNGQSFFGDPASGTLMWLGDTESNGFSLERLEHNYDVFATGTARVDTGVARVVEIRERGSRTPRERLYVDERSGLLVRRETFDARGRPVRLTAFTVLEPSPLGLPAVGEDWPRVVRTINAGISPRSLSILRSVGWIVPDGLPPRFTLVEASAMGGEAQDSVLHLLFTDGLYSLSVYEQSGRLDARALEAEGAETARLGDVRVYRRKGSEPATYLWNGNGMTFTAVSDAPSDLLAASLAPFPRDPPPSLARRLRRGLVRVRSWVWPFD